MKWIYIITLPAIFGGDPTIFNIYFPSLLYFTDDDKKIIHISVAISVVLIPFIFAAVTS